MIVVSDTSAITSLLQIGRLAILPALYQNVVIPVEVANELLRFHATLPGFIQVMPVADRALFKRFLTELDPGEAAAIALMLEGKGDLLLMDERRGRAVAAREGLAVVGVIGVLVEARHRGLITSLAGVIDDLERLAGFRISPRLRQQVLETVGEK
jgi:predicted nucleic acid-binding protein